MGKEEAAILLFLGVFYLRISFATTLNRSNADESSLLSLKTHINSNILANNWSQETFFCTWIGVDCSRRYPRVTGLSLSNMGLQGTIAKEIGNLSFLTFLDMSNNSIHGLIPGEIGNLRRLRILNIAFNQLTDHIPQSLGNLSQLQHLSLRGNQLAGSLPSAIFNISSLLTISVGDNQISGSIPKHICSQPAKLEVLRLRANKFEGEIPSTLMRCRSLKILSLAINNFSGNIPSELWNLSAIQEVSFARNQFTGIIPPSISNLSNLMLFDIGTNRFHGNVPSEIGQLSSLTFLGLQLNKLNGELPQSIFNLSALQVLGVGYNYNLSGTLPLSIDNGLPNIELFYLSANQFRGKIPNSISNLSRLTKIDLFDNSFTGHVPTTLGNLRQLEFLNLEHNQFTNNVSKPEQDFLSSLATCKYLKDIWMEFNPITGVIPKSLGSSNFSASLKYFLAKSCRIISPLPNEIGNLSNLLWLDLAYNDLTGAIPTTLGRLSKLQNLELQGNRLQGSFSHDLCSLKNLYSANLAENNFFGQLPRCLGNLPLLRNINLSYNALNSSFPSTFWFNGHLERVDLSNNFLHGSLSGEIGNMKSLIELDLSRNQLSGEIPSTITQLQNLINLSLSNNKLDGPIIESFSNLKGLQYLDLSHNNLSGLIPKSLEALAYLNYFNVSFNELRGEIPDRGPFVNFTAELFIGNKGLCGASRFKVEACKRSKPARSRENKLLEYILPAIASVIAVAFILILVLRCRGRKLPHSSPFDLPHRLMRERISYREILSATSNLDEENLIGKGSFGSVYKGIFSDAEVVAVKVFNLNVQDALKSFDTECQIMRSVRHRNLVKVITSCSNLDFKALVMAYMPNGNLEKWLYSASCSLNIFQRLEIMIDVASALEYLHEDFTSTIVHCDLKPNNILLDQHMVAHVGDFGIAKLLIQEQRMQQTRTLGTIGYMAPEYGLEGLVSTMVDVYSYGILLMEIFSRRKPTDEMFSGELTMKRWVSESFPNSVMQIVDEELPDVDDKSIRDGQESCLKSIIGVALECTADLPKERPNMKDVLARIKKIKLNLTNSN